MVASLNPPWNVPMSNSEIDQRFERASTLIGEACLGKLDFYAQSWLPARDIVEAARKARDTLNLDGRVLHLPQFCPWQVCLICIWESLIFFRSTSSSWNWTTGFLVKY